MRCVTLVNHCLVLVRNAARVAGRFATTREVPVGSSEFLSSPGCVPHGFAPGPPGWYNGAMPIHILSPEVANQIAAGEVVERPASVVKELIENSLDAGATDIRVEVREGGRRQVRVQDNGCGIPAGDARLAFERHATSKINNIEDLDRIGTLGFRGEALASIAAVAQVTLLTRAREEETGTLIRMSEGREVAREPKGTPAGTIVTVEHLFANVPARLKFLKQPTTEAGHIQQMVTRYALAYPERRLSLLDDGKLLFQSSGSGKLYDVLVKVYGLDMARQMLPLEISEQADDWSEEQSSARTPAYLTAPHARVSGYAGAPGLHRSHRGYITLFINRRWFQDSSIAYGVIQAYHTWLPVGRYPVAVIFIELDPAEVDVNVHPTKAEVRFRDSRAIFSAVQRAVRRALTEHAPIPQIGASAPLPATLPGLSPAEMAAWSARRDALLGAGRDQETFFAQAEGMPAEAMLAGPTDLPGVGLPGSPLPAPAKIPLLRVVGQLGAAYIVAEGPDGLYLIDQHAAHERILYERMLAQYAGNTLEVQSLLEPLVLDLNPEQAAVVAEEFGTLNELGLHIEPFGGSSYLIRSIPAILSGEDPHSALAEIFDGLGAGTDVAEASREAALVTLICKRAAVKGGHTLSLTEMQEIVRQLEMCRSPRTCPHGRPTMVYMSAAELARQFGRM
jgi:DNA mismatch repair protein MutL